MTKVEILCEGHQFKVDSEMIQKSTTLMHLQVESLECTRIEIRNIALPILQKILEFCDHYRHSVPKMIHKPLKSADLAECGADQWDVDFIRLDSIEELIDLTVSADFLEINELVILCCAKIASIKMKERMTETSSSSATGAVTFELETRF